MTIFVILCCKVIEALQIVEEHIFPIHWLSWWWRSAWDHQKLCEIGTYIQHNLSILNFHTQFSLSSSYGELLLLPWSGGGEMCIQSIGGYRRGDIKAWLSLKLWSKKVIIREEPISLICTTTIRAWRIFQGYKREWRYKAEPGDTDISL